MARFEKVKNIIYFDPEEGTNKVYKFDINSGIWHGTSGKPLKTHPTCLPRILKMFIQDKSQKCLNILYWMSKMDFYDGEHVKHC